MLIAHLADVHLGYRAYHRTAKDGVNQRERDVADALGRVVDQVIAAAPGLVVVAGDLFHTARPSNDAITEAFRQLARLRGELSAAPIVLIAGAHDAPRSAEAGSILRLLAEIPDVHVADRGERAIRLGEGEIHVHCLPHPAMPGRGMPEPDPDATINVLVAHGMVTGPGVETGPARRAGRGGVRLDRSHLGEEAWDYVALGGHHDAVALGPRVWYAGATERTSSDIWAESRSQKGWVLYDTDTSTGEHRTVETRPVVELPVFSVRAGQAASGDGDGTTGPAERWLPPEVVDERIRAAAESLIGGVSGKIVRQVISDVPRELFRQLDHDRIRQLKAAAVHFHLEVRRPRLSRRKGAGGLHPRTLEEELAAFLAAWEPDSPGIDRDRLLALGTAYLAGAYPDSGGRE